MMFYIYFIILYVFVIHSTTILVLASTDDSTIVQTSSGTVIGKIVQGNTNKDTAVFYGIPYAEPPIGENRFFPPKPVKPWSDAIQATEKPLPCYQFYPSNFLEHSREFKKLIRRPWSEDCLTLNIWVPQPTPKKAPVLVFLHSGSFSTGSGTYPVLDGSSTLAAESNNIVVTVNYRLGPFGFLSFGIPEAPGNVGLLDQQLAMKWIKANIHFFGGKTEAILLVGENDAGSASVGYHLMAKSSEGLFKTVTVISGSVLCLYAFQTQESNLKAGNQLSRYLGCDKNNQSEEIHCLKNAHAEDIVDAHRALRDRSNLSFRPTVDGNFITESPYEAMESGRFSKVPVLSITNSREGSIFLKVFNPEVMSDPEKGITIEGFRKSVKRITPNLRQSVLDVVEDMYVDQCSRHDPIKLRDAAIRLYSDVVSDCCLNRYMDFLVQHGSPVFFNLNDLSRASDPAWIGSSHEIIMMYILGYPLAPEKYGFTNRQAEDSGLFIGWINDNARKKLGDPTSSLLRHNLEDRPYVFWKHVPHNRSHYRTEACAFWNEVIPKLNDHDHGNCN